jgi:hypothetical protein
MAKLNQIIAVVNGKKTKCQKALTAVYKNIQASELFNGISRTYEPLDAEGETQPSEQKLVQFTANQAILDAQKALTELLDVVATQDVANTTALADVVVDGKIIVEQVPVTHLLFLEKQLVDIHTFVSKLPTLDPAYEWSFDDNKNVYSTPATFSNRTKKVLKTLSKAKATKEHAEQVEVFSEDEKVGEWSTIRFSGNMPAKEKQEMLDRVTQLQEAVKFAREEANSMEVENMKVGEDLLSYVFKK